MATRRFALVAGIIYFLVGIAGLIPALLSPPPAGAPALVINALNGYLFHLFPVNAAHTAVHLIIGLWGLGVANNTGRSLMYARSVAVIYAILTIMGLVPSMHTMFGLMPLQGNDVWLHAATALIAAYFGFFAMRTPGERPTGGSVSRS